jgi:hypothetical protein
MAGPDQEEREYANGQIDVKDPSPQVAIGDPTTRSSVRGTVQVRRRVRKARRPGLVSAVRASTSMKAAGATVAAISQGLAFGFHCSLLPTSAAIHFFLHLWTAFRSFSIMAAIRLDRLSVVVSIGSVGVHYKDILYLKAYCM